MATTLGRPRTFDSGQRQQEFMRLLVDECLPWDLAARGARVKPETVLRWLNRADFAAVALSVLTAQLVEPVKVAA